MKKLRRRLERRLTRIMSRAALYCEGKNYFRVSTSYEFLIDPFKFYVTKLAVEVDPRFHYKKWADR